MSIKPDPIKSARAIGFPHDADGPPRHWPSFRVAGVEIPPGMAYCLRCGQIVTSVQWAREVCEAPPPPEADEGGGGTNT